MSNIFDLFKKIEQKPVGPVSFIIVGLGNIGKQYELTRHNAGFLAIDYIAEKYGAKIDRVKFHATVGEATIGGERVLLMKPTTLMNNSGIAVGEAAAFYKIPLEDIIVLHDDISLDVGKLRIRRKGSDGGQKGMRDIIELFGSDNISRIKIGVGAKPHPDYNLADWVLSKFTKEELETLSESTKKVSLAIKEIIMRGIDSAMNKYSS